MRLEGRLWCGIMIRQNCNICVGGFEDEQYVTERRLESVGKDGR